jgi:hypothetical protein
MLLAFLSTVVALACTLASLRRLTFAVRVTELDPQVMADALARASADKWVTLRDAVAARGPAWDSALWAAFSEPTQSAREAAIGEQLLELDWRAQRWQRVPRVCARVAANAGFICASIALMGGLAEPEVDFGPALAASVGAIAAGLCGMFFCAVVHFRCRTIVRDRLAATGRLLDRMRAMADQASPQPG